jgi:acetyl-CoA carboxylase alpha subunit
MVVLADAAERWLLQFWGHRVPIVANKLGTGASGGAKEGP